MLKIQIKLMKMVTNFRLRIISGISYMLEQHRAPYTSAKIPMPIYMGFFITKVMPLDDPIKRGLLLKAFVCLLFAIFCYVWGHKVSRSMVRMPTVPTVPKAIATITVLTIISELRKEIWPTAPDVPIADLETVIKKVIDKVLDVLDVPDILNIPDELIIPEEELKYIVEDVIIRFLVIRKLPVVPDKDLERVVEKVVEKVIKKYLDWQIVRDKNSESVVGKYLKTVIEKVKDVPIVPTVPDKDLDKCIEKYLDVLDVLDLLRVPTVRYKDLDRVVEKVIEKALKKALEGKTVD